ncbi:hypothetical protein HPB47_022635, partial [Ixodes persulcatus]
MTPAFRFRALENYMTIFNQNADLFVRRLCSFVDKAPSEPIRLFENTQKCALDIIGGYLRILNESGDILAHRFSEYADGTFNEPIQLFQSAQRCALDIIGDNQAVPKGVQCFVNVFRLHRNPKYFRDPERYRPERFMREETTFRPPFVYIPFSGGARKCLEGHVISKGVMCFISIYSLHRNPKYFKDPEEFIPESFSSEEIKTRHPFSYIPFSGGSKNCLGQKFAMLEMKLLLAKILLRCKIVSAEPLNRLNVAYEVIVKDKRGKR